MSTLHILKYDNWSDIASPLQAIICDEKPSQLSDPFDEFTPDELMRILEKEPLSLDVKDYMNLFYTSFPAGDFLECAFYLPYALQYILNNINNSDCIEVLGRINCWVNNHGKELGKLNFLSYFHDFSIDLYKRCFAISPFDNGNWKFFYARMEIIRELCDNVADGWVDPEIFLETMDYLRDMPILVRSLCLVSICRHLNFSHAIFSSPEKEVKMMPLFKSKFNNQFLMDSRSLLREHSAYYLDGESSLEFIKFLMKEDDTFL